MSVSPDQQPSEADTTGRLLLCFREVFPELSDEQILNARFDELEEWDSLASLNLVAIIEEEFDRVIPDDLVADLTSFARIRDAIA